MIPNANFVREKFLRCTRKNENARLLRKKK